MCYGSDFLDDSAVVLLLREVKDVYDAGLVLHRRRFVVVVILSVPMPSLLQHLVCLHHHVDIPAEEQREPSQAHVDPQLCKHSVQPGVFNVWIHTCNRSSCTNMTFHFMTTTRVGKVFSKTRSTWSNKIKPTCHIISKTNRREGDERIVDTL